MKLFDEESFQHIAEFTRTKFSDFFQDRIQHDALCKATHHKYPKTVYPPLILSNEGNNTISQVSEALIRLIGDIPDLLFNGSYEKWVSAQGFVGAEAKFLVQQLYSTPKEKTLAIARADALATTDGFKFVELNISPALGGLGVCDGYSSRIQQSALCSFLSSAGVDIVYPHSDRAWLNALNAHLWPDYPMPEHPFFFEAIANPNEAPEDSFDRPEWIYGLKNAGFHVMTGHISKLRLTSNGIYVGDERVDVLYFCFTYHEMLQFGISPAIISALTEADRAGLINFFTSFSTIPYDNKVNFSFLTDQRYRKNFSSDQRKLIDLYIPKTRILTRESIAFAKERKDDLVLKAGIEFGGTGVFIGANFSDEEWNIVLQQSLAGGRPFVLQDRINNIRTGAYDSATEDLQTVCLAPMLFNQKAAGIFLRATTYRGKTEVMNVAQGAQFGTALVRT